MTFDEFKESLSHTAPPKNIPQNLLALWRDSTGSWDEAHKIVQKTSGFDGDWIHAYLHRKEGDLSNASYWYSRIGKILPQKSLNQEWEELVRHLVEGKN